MHPMKLFLVATSVYGSGCTNDFVGFQPAEKLKYDEKGDKVASGLPNERAVCFDLNTPQGPNATPEASEESECEICVGSPGHLVCKQGIQNLAAGLEDATHMDCVENVEHLDIDDVWVKMSSDCKDPLWIDAVLVWADKWTCSNPSAATSYKHTGKTFKATPPNVEKTNIAYGKSNDYGWCLSNDAADALKWNKKAKEQRHETKKVLGDTCYPVLRFSIDGGEPVVQGYNSADLLEAAELEAIKALYMDNLPRGRRRRLKRSDEYRELQRTFKRRLVGQSREIEGFPTVTDVSFTVTSDELEGED